MFLSFGGKFLIFCHFDSIFSKILKNIENYLKNDKKTNNDNASRRMQFLQPAILFVIFLSFGGKFIIFLSLWCHFLKNMENMENCSKNDEKMTKKMAMLREKCTFCNLQNCHFVCHFLSFGGFF